MMPSMAFPKKTLYEILGVPRDANESDIGYAHDRRVSELRRILPPDPSAQALVQQAFEILSDAKRRAAYDAQLVTVAERNAAAEQSTPDLEIGEEEKPLPRLPWIPLGIVAVIIVAGLVFVARKSEAPKPAAAPVAEAPKPAPPPPPPRARSAAEVLGSAATSTGAVMVYSMSGSATPIGLGTAIEAATMVTPCHAIPAGGKLVVRVGKEQLPADLTITDEALDLCRLSVPGHTTPPLKLAPEDPKVGDKIYTLGLDAGGQITAAEGTVKALRKGAAGPLIEISTPVPATASGGGVFDQYGNLLGIATARHDQGPGVNVAISAASIAQMRSRTK